MKQIDFEDGKAVKDAVLRLMSLPLLCLQTDYDKEGRKIYVCSWGAGAETLQISWRSNGFSLFLDILFRFLRPVCDITTQKSLVIPVSGEPSQKDGLPGYVNLLRQSIENYQPV